MSSLSSSNALAVRSVTNSNSGMLIYPVLVAFGVALIAISAKIQVPFWPVPMTLQGLAVAGLAAAFGLRLGLATIIAYLAVGFVGVPVFAGPVAGPLYFVGPTAGFLAGFVVMTAIVGFVADRVSSASFWKLLGAMFVGDVLLFALGFVWLGYFFVTGSGTTLGAGIAWAKGVEPYILGDLFKMVLAAAAVPAINALMSR